MANATKVGIAIRMPAGERTRSLVKVEIEKAEARRLLTARFAICSGERAPPGAALKAALGIWGCLTPRIYQQCTLGWGGCPAVGAPVVERKADGRVAGGDATSVSA
jgi:hypothetical protein